MPRRPLSSRSRKVAATLGEYLVTFRKLQGLTAEQVADRAGIPRTTLRRLEHGDPSGCAGRRLERIAGRSVLLLDRFDRTPDGARIPYLCAMSLLTARDGNTAAVNYLTSPRHSPSAEPQPWISPG